MTSASDQGSASTQLDFQSYYLKRSTQEMGEDLEQVRTADDFKVDSVQFLVQALQQGSTQFNSEEQTRILSAIPAASNQWLTGTATVATI